MADIEHSISCEFYSIHDPNLKVVDQIERFYNEQTDFQNRILNTVPELEPYGLRYFKKEGENCFGTFIIIKNRNQFTSTDKLGNIGPLDLKEGKDLSIFFTFAYIKECHIIIIHRWKIGGGKAYVQSYLRRKCGLSNLFLLFIPTETGLSKLLHARELGKASIKVAMPSSNSLFYEDSGDIDKEIDNSYAHIAALGKSVNAADVEIIFTKRSRTPDFLNREKLASLIYKLIENKKEDIESVKVGAKYEVEDDGNIAIGDYSYEEILKDRAKEKATVKYPEHLIQTSPSDVMECFYDALRKAYLNHKAFLIEYTHGSKDKEK